MRLHSTKSFTLLEVVISLILISILVILFAAIERIGISHTLALDRYSRVQNDLTYILEHSTKQISKAIGNTKINRVSTDGDQIINTATISGDKAIEFYVDAAADYISPGDGLYGTGGDHWRAYRFRPSTAIPSSDSYQLWYCPRCSVPICDTCCAGCTPSVPWGMPENTMSKKVKDVTYDYNPVYNYVDITIQGCWDPNQAASRSNPGASMKERIKLPSVSIQ
jgi:hypothetical protein